MNFRSENSRASVGDASTMVAVPPSTEVLVSPVGHLDLVTAGSLERHVRDIQSSRPGRIVIDLRDVDFLDSVGLGALISLRNDAKRNDQRLALVPGPPGVQRIFHLTGTRGLFDWRE